MRNAGQALQAQKNCYHKYISPEDFNVLKKQYNITTVPAAKSDQGKIFIWHRNNLI
jgi:hypothetical protein